MKRAKVSFEELAKWARFWTIPISKGSRRKVHKIVTGKKEGHQFLDPWGVDICGYPPPHLQAGRFCTNWAVSPPKKFGQDSDREVWGENTGDDKAE